MATARLMFRTARPPLPLGLPSSSSSSASASLSGTTVRCVSKAGFIEADDRKSVSMDGETRNSVLAVKASAATSEPILCSELRAGRGILLSYLASLVVANVIKAAMSTLRSMAVEQRLYVQLFIERAIIDCRFFTLFAVVGSLFGSVLCFLEGCFTILESYLQYFHSFSDKSNQEHVMQLLIEAIDMFLVGTAMLMFGMGLYVIFVGNKTMTRKGPLLSGSNLFGLFYMKTLPAWVEMQSVSQAKSKIGHAVIMILQVGVLQKLKNIPLVSGVDLACFAGAVLISSASIFLLSRLSAGSDIPSKIGI
ncbi:uncharacterized protein LOC121244603 [Juglans microcarpa x Juglans regia]|uniref:uncharacterized protein LOC121244603 n=1 Tax=Juglans microcarpa x Juglans regia TaxID=2249226 RepID=UPI001B7D92FC|nr:uncharacterized protein LOC121244603 [Juglans microcarpa x Juglans regia]